MNANGWGILAEAAGNMNGGCSGWEVAERKKGAWTPEEDKLLTEYVNLHGDGRWSSVAQCAGLNRSGKSCRLRWVNYLRPGLKRGQMTPFEEAIIIELHALWGNKWSTIARYLPGRTDNEIKNYWRTHFKNKEKKQEKLRSVTTTQVQEEEMQQQRQKQHKYEAEDPMEIGDVRMIQPIDRQESDVFTFPMALEDQYGVPRGTIGSWLNTTGEDELWDGLWDLDGTNTIWEFRKLGDVF